MNTAYGYDRIDAINQIPKELVYYEPAKIPRKETWTKQIQYAFVISPHGNGLDCHRTWEAIALGCIPIVKTSGLDPLFEGLPVWIVSAWSEVTQDNMSAKINEFKEKEFRLERLTLDYWRKVIWGKRTG